MPIYVLLTHTGQLAKQICISGADSCRLPTDCPPKCPTTRSPKRKQLPPLVTGNGQKSPPFRSWCCTRQASQTGDPRQSEELPQSPAPRLKLADGGGEKRRREEPDTGAAQRETHSLRIPQTRTWLKTHRWRQAPSALGELRCH